MCVCVRERERGKELETKGQKKYTQRIKQTMKVRERVKEKQKYTQRRL